MNDDEINDLEEAKENFVEDGTPIISVYSRDPLWQEDK